MHPGRAVQLGLSSQDGSHYQIVHLHTEYIIRAIAQKEDKRLCHWASEQELLCPKAASAIAQVIGE